MYGIEGIRVSHMPHMPQALETLPLFEHMVTQALSLPPDAYNAQACMPCVYECKCVCVCVCHVCMYACMTLMTLCLCIWHSTYIRRVSSVSPLARTPHDRPDRVRMKLQQAIPSNNPNRTAMNNPNSTAIGLLSNRTWRGCHRTVQIE